MFPTVLHYCPLPCPCRIEQRAWPTNMYCHNKRIEHVQMAKQVFSRALSTTRATIARPHAFAHGISTPHSQ